MKFKLNLKQSTRTKLLDLTGRERGAVIHIVAGSKESEELPEGQVDHLSLLTNFLGCQLLCCLHHRVAHDVQILRLERRKAKVCEAV